MVPLQLRSLLASEWRLNSRSQAFLASHALTLGSTRCTRTPYSRAPGSALLTYPSPPAWFAPGHQSPHPYLHLHLKQLHWCKLDSSSSKQLVQLGSLCMLYVRCMSYRSRNDSGRQTVLISGIQLYSRDCSLLLRTIWDTTFWISCIF